MGGVGGAGHDQRSGQSEELCSGSFGGGGGGADRVPGLGSLACHRGIRGSDVSGVRQWGGVLALFVHVAAKGFIELGEWKATGGKLWWVTFVLCLGWVWVPCILLECDQMELGLSARHLPGASHECIARVRTLILASEMIEELGEGRR